MSGLSATVSDTFVLAQRNLLRIARQPDLLTAFTVQPIMFVLLFVYVFGGAIADAVRLLDRAGLGVDDIELQRPTLDDVFLELTGHTAEEAEEEAAA